MRKMKLGDVNEDGAVNFDDASFASEEISARFYRREGRFYVRTEGPEGRNSASSSLVPGLR